MKTKYLTITLLLFIDLSCAKEYPSQAMGIFAPARLEYISAQDGVTPVKINNRLIFTFGDTILTNKIIGTENGPGGKAKSAGGRMISNSIAAADIPDDGNINNLILTYHTAEGQPAEFIKTKNEHGKIIKYWPAGGYYIDPYLYIYVYEIIFGGGGSSSLFRVSGVYIAQLEANLTGKFSVRLKSMKKLFDHNEIVLGDSVTHYDGYLYLAGRKKAEKGGHTLGIISRVRVDKIADHKSYEFLSRGGWTSEIKNCVLVIEGIIGEFSLTFNSGRNKFIFTWCDITGAINCSVVKDLSDPAAAVKTVIFKAAPIQNAKGFMKFYYSGKEIFCTKDFHYSIYIDPEKIQPVLLKTPLDIISGL